MMATLGTKVKAGDVIGIQNSSRVFVNHEFANDVTFGVDDFFD